MRTRTRRTLLALAVGLAILAAAPGSAAADVFYASPSGSGSTCSSGSPCNIETAVETVANPGDEVVVGPGTHSVGVGALQILNGIRVHGQAGGPRPLIEGTSFSVLETFDPDARVEDLMVRNSNGDALYLSSGTLDRVVAIATGTSGVGCFVEPNPPPGFLTIRNSACVATGPGGRGVSSNISAAGNDYVSGALRNSTVIATGSGSLGIRLSCSGGVPGGSCTINAQNTIVSGIDYDISLLGNANTAVAVNLQRSNYADLDLGSNSTVTPTGTAGNQTAPPLLAAPASGNVRQLAASPTIDAGGADPLAGSLDLDGQARLQGLAPDIGADEFVSTRCRGAAPTMIAGAGITTGTAGADVIVGTSGRNVIKGLGGTDLICSRGGRDTVRAGRGRDTVLGGGGGDGLFGGGGRDLLKGQAGRDLLVGGGGRDRCRGGPGRDRNRRC